MRGGRRKRAEVGPMKHVRLELPQDEHEILKTLAGLKEKTTLGYVRWLVRREILRIKRKKELVSAKGR